jgi:hypothetical protein
MVGHPGRPQIFLTLAMCSSPVRAAGRNGSRARAHRRGRGCPEDSQRRAQRRVGLERGIAGALEDNGAVRGWTGLGEALKRWAPRVPDLAPARDLATMQRLGGRMIIPADGLWPRQLSDLGLQEPLCLWWRGIEQELPPPAKAVALVGSRDSTSYGSSVTADLAYSLAQRGFTVVSGGAYGIDAQPIGPPWREERQACRPSPSWRGEWTASIPPGTRTCSGPSRTRVPSWRRSRRVRRPLVTASSNTNVECMR